MKKTLLCAFAVAVLSGCGDIPKDAPPPKMSESRTGSNMLKPESEDSKVNRMSKEDFERIRTETQDPPPPGR